MFLLANNYSEKKAKSAKEGSTVKIAGRDVMATWKLLIALGVVPLMHASYTTLAYVFFGQTASVAFFFFAPFVCASSILATERGNKLLASLKPLWIMMSHEKESLRHLVQTRRALAKQARRVIEDFELGEFSFMYRYILRESCSQFDSLPLTSLTISPRCRAPHERGRRPPLPPVERRALALRAGRRRRRAVSGACVAAVAVAQRWFRDAILSSSYA